MTVMTQKQAGKAYTEVRKFNRYAGQLKNVSKGSIALQLDLIQEEYLESVEAFDTQDTVGLLDGAIDMFVVVSGLLHKLEASGYDVGEAMKRVTNNNLTKFVESLDISFACQNNYKCVIEDFDGVPVKSYRDINGKLRKGPDYVSVEIEDCAPKEFFK